MRIAIILLFSVMLASCREEVVELGAGYKYVQLDGSTFAIADRDNRIVVHPNVTSHSVVGFYIIGKRQGAKIDLDFSRNFGYFILDTRSGQLIEGLSKNSAVAFLRERNLPAGSI